MTVQFEEHTVRDALKSSWSRHSAKQWTPENPAAGQCNVTAAVVQELFGGEVLRTGLVDGFHYYNRIDGRSIDFTSGQFAAPIAYDDVPSSRQEALQGIATAEYEALRNSMLHKLHAARSPATD